MLPLISFAHLWSVFWFRKGVRVVRDDDQNSTDLMKCIWSLQEKEEADGVDVGGLLLPLRAIVCDPGNLYFHPFPLSIILLFFFFLFRLLTTSSYLVASLGDSTRPSTYYRIYTSSGKADADYSSLRTRT